MGKRPERASFFAESHAFDTWLFIDVKSRPALK